MERSVERNRLAQGLLLVGLVLTGVIARVYFRGIPNFMPVAGLALFAGYFFSTSSRWKGLLVPVAIMAISDLFLAGYMWQMRIIVYGAMLLPVGFGALLGRIFKMQSQRPRWLAGTALGMIACSLASSVVFFLATNFAWWPWSSMYDKNWEGLMHCYAAGLPFFKYTLAGDLFFSTVLFGGYAAVMNWQAIEHTNLDDAKVLAE